MTEEGNKLTFSSIDTVRTSKYPIMRVLFRLGDKQVYWVPKWKELYEILDDAIETEESNWIKSPWRKILNEIREVLQKRSTKPFIRRRFHKPKPPPWIAQQETVLKTIRGKLSCSECGSLNVQFLHESTYYCSDCGSVFYPQKEGKKE
jgi:ribosomal protein S27AE